MKDIQHALVVKYTLKSFSRFSLYKASHLRLKLNEYLRFQLLHLPLFDGAAATLLA